MRKLLRWRVPRVQRLPERAQWLVWGLAIALGMWMVSRVRRGRGLFVSAVAIFVALTLSYLLFQSELLWCPPALPSAVLLAAGVITLLFGRSGMAAGAASVEVEVGEKESVDQVGEVP